MAEKKEKQYVSDNAQLMAEWNWEKNGNSKIAPQSLTLGSGQKVWWRCSKGHEWQATIDNRNKGRGCPYCAGRAAIKGTNDLETVNPILATEWYYLKNDGLTPADVLPNSNKIVWWQCNERHIWQARIADRNRGKACPYCAGQKVSRGSTDLQTVNPTLAKEWNYKKNTGLSPADVLPNSGKKVWWICSKGHEWQSTIYNRNNGNGCPFCVSEQHTSFPEYAIVYYLKQHGLEIIHSYKDNGYELDVYIPSKMIALEYDGYFWHKTREHKDLEKNKKCKIDGIKLYRIREGLPVLNDSSIDFVIRKDQKDLPSILKIILGEIIGSSIDVDLDRDAIAIDNLREYTEKQRSFLFSNPEMANEWDYEKNGKLKPEHFSANSEKKVWWKCSNGHQWRATINHRNNGSGCPVCSGQKALKGYNDLQTANPILASEWNYNRNSNLVPEDFTAHSGRKVWWKCTNGHEWQATIASRAKGIGCPFCSGRYAVKGKSDLLTVNPTLATEWNYEKNIGLTPSEILPNSNKKVWWKCCEGHEWQATVANRTAGINCPYCSGRYALKGKNDLTTINPTLAAEWNYEKNNNLLPEDFTAHSGRKVWWICSVGHEWQATIANRSRTRGNGCPECSRRKK